MEVYTTECPNKDKHEGGEFLINLYDDYCGYEFKVNGEFDWSVISREPIPKNNVSYSSDVIGMLILAVLAAYLVFIFST